MTDPAKAKQLYASLSRWHRVRPMVVQRIRGSGRVKSSNSTVRSPVVSVLEDIQIQWLCNQTYCWKRRRPLLTRSAKVKHFVLCFKSTALMPCFLDSKRPKFEITIEFLAVIRHIKALFVETDFHKLLSSAKADLKHGVISKPLGAVVIIAHQSCKYVRIERIK